MPEQRMTSDEVRDAIGRERVRLMAAVDALGADATTVPVTEEGWTAKDVLAHSIHWAGQIAWGMGAPLQPPPYVATVSGRPSGDEWNALVVAYYRAGTLDQVRSELDRVVDALIEQTRLRTDDQINATDAIPWGGDRPLWQQIGSETFLHWPAHAAQIEQATPGA
jgi:hypothetical protein